MGNILININCSCLSPIFYKENNEVSEFNLNYDANKEVKKHHTVNTGRTKRTELLQEKLKTVVIQDITDNKITKYTEEFEENLKPGVVVSPRQLPVKVDAKIIEIESKLGKFQLTKEDQELVSNPKLKNFAILYADNTICEGQFNPKWEKEGYGCLYLSFGSKYEGLFLNDYMLRGRLINIEGDYYEGR